jgi:beta-lactamase regulating signal transducer with metallopeptidase domain
MTTIQFLAEWALRSSILILSGALLLRIVRVKDPSIRLAAWIAVLCGSMALPALVIILPSALPNALPRALPRVLPNVLRPMPPLPLMVARLAVDPRVARETKPAPISKVASRQDSAASKTFDWALAALGVYILVAGALLLRLCAGLAMSRRLLRQSRATGRQTEGIEIRESDSLAAPAALGVVRSVIVLPSDWREWDGAKLEAVVAHERSHVRRNDPAAQLLSAIHRALLWHSPLSWFLHRRIVRVAEEASDDAAVSATRDRASYAEVLLDFMQRGIRGANWQGVAMARYGRPDERIHRILDGTALSRGVTRWSVAAILALGLPVVYLTAAAQTQVAAIAPISPKARVTAATAESAESAATTAQVAATDTQAAEPASAASSAQEAATPAPAPQKDRGIRRYMIVSGTSMSGSWDSDDQVDQQGLREKFGQNFAWFRQGGNEYVVTDAGVLAALDKAMEPQKEVNRMQHGVNDQQAEVNRHQAEVNRAQNGVNAIQAAANRRQHLINELQAAKGDDELIRRLEATLAELKANKGESSDQEAANRAQDKVNEMQARVNQEQGKVNEQQSKVNDEQRRASAVMEGRIEEILDSAVRRQLVQPMR